VKIYLASSWRNESYPSVLAALRTAGHNVYDFRAGNYRSDCHESHADYVRAPRSRAASKQFNAELAALDACYVCVLLLPCGRSAHLEAGYAAGRGKQVVVYPDAKPEFELMYRLTNGFVDSIPNLLTSLASPAGGVADADATYLMGMIASFPHLRERKAKPGALSSGEQ
jgi:hypothetical protein